MITQEAKYAEDIIRQIKDDLDRRGFINEHDKLGHFEAVVPLDTILALAKPKSIVKIIGLQFKSPKALKKKLYWSLTHPTHQFQLLTRHWSNIIFYALPYYLSPIESSDALKKTYFVNATGMASKHLSIISGESKLPLPFRDYLRALIIFRHDVHLKDLCNSIAKHGLDPVMKAINDYFKAKFDASEYLRVSEYCDENNKEYLFLQCISKYVSKVEADLGISKDVVCKYIDGFSNPSYEGKDSELVETTSEIKERILSEFREVYERNKRLYGHRIHWLSDLCEKFDHYKSVLDRGPRYNILSEAQQVLEDIGLFDNRLQDLKVVIKLPGAYDMTRDMKKATDWSKMVLSNLELTLSVRLIANPTETKKLLCESRLVFHKLTFLNVHTFAPTGDNSWLRTVDSEFLPWPRYHWSQFIDEIENCHIGAFLNDNVKDGLRKQFSELFPMNTEGLLMWCDFVEKVYYAIETRRITVGNKEIGTVTDPMSSGIPPDLRAWVAKEAHRRGVRMSDIVKEALEKMRNDLGN